VGEGDEGGVGSDVGTCVEDLLGGFEGGFVGFDVGVPRGSCVGEGDEGGVGCDVGSLVGASDGVGSLEGAGVGDFVGIFLHCLQAAAAARAFAQAAATAASYTALAFALLSLISFLSLSTSSYVSISITTACSAKQAAIAQGSTTSAQIMAAAVYLAARLMRMRASSFLASASILSFVSFKIFLASARSFA
jgi:hypothetical protein